MADSFASGKTKAVLPTFGSYVDTWNQPVNADMSTIDAALSGTTSINVASILATSPFVNITFSEFNATANPTPWTQPNAGQNLRINLSGVLNFGITVYLQQIPGFWIFSNNTAGSFPITVSTTASSGTSVIIPQGYSSVLFSDGTNVIWADQGNVIANVPSAIPPGTINPYGGASIPAGWLFCNGAAYSRATYANLFAAIGTIWGAGDGSTTFNVPNFTGQFLRGADGINTTLGGFQINQFGTHTHTVTDPGHRHTPANGGQFLYIGGTPNTGPTYYAGGSGDNIGFTSTNTTGITIASTGASETRPDNYGVNYMIKT